MQTILFGGTFTVLLAALITWLLKGETSPLAEYFLWNPDLPNFWGLLNLPSYLVGALFSGNAHDINLPAAYTTFAVQWMLIGSLITFISSKFFNRDKTI